MENLLQYLLIGGGCIMIGGLIVELHYANKRKKKDTIVYEGRTAAEVDKCTDDDCECKQPAAQAWHTTEEGEMQIRNIARVDPHRVSAVKGVFRAKGVKRNTV